MSSVFTTTDTVTFTITHARYMAAKVATDLKRIQRLYDKPNDEAIDAYEEEVIDLLKAGYLNSVIYGFKRNGLWIPPTVRYTAEELSFSSNDDDPGKIRPGCDVSDASFYSYLTYSSAWDELTEEERQNFKKSLSIQRTGADAPKVDGYFDSDKTYASGGRSLNRSSVRSW